MGCINRFGLCLAILLTPLTFSGHVFADMYAGKLSVVVGNNPGGSLESVFGGAPGHWNWGCLASQSTPNGPQDHFYGLVYEPVRIDGEWCYSFELLRAPLYQKCFDENARVVGRKIMPIMEDSYHLQWEDGDVSIEFAITRH